MLLVLCIISATLCISHVESAAPMDKYSLPAEEDYRSDYKFDVLDVSDMHQSVLASIAIDPQTLNIATSDKKHTTKSYKGQNVYVSLTTIYHRQAQAYQTIAKILAGTKCAKEIS